MMIGVEYALVLFNAPFEYPDSFFVLALVHES